MIATEEGLCKRKLNQHAKPNMKPQFTKVFKSLTEEKIKAYLQLPSQTITCDDYKIVSNKANIKIQAIKM